MNNVDTTPHDFHSIFFFNDTATTDTYPLSLPDALPISPVANNDAGTATEAGGTANGTAGSNATGNVIMSDANGGGADNNFDDTTALLTIAAIRTGAVEGSGTAGTVGSRLVGWHGTLTLNADGSSSYAINNADAAVQALNSGDTTTDSFNYTVKDSFK